MCVDVIESIVRSIFTLGEPYTQRHGTTRAGNLPAFPKPFFDMSYAPNMAVTGRTVGTILDEKEG